MMIEHDPYVDIIDTIQETVSITLNKLEDIHQLFDYVKLIMEALEQENLDGKKKKALALKILKKIIDISELDEAKKADCLALINNNVISNAIDIIVLAASGEMQLNMSTGIECSKFIIPCGISMLSKKQK